MFGPHHLSLLRLQENPLFENQLKKMGVWRLDQLFCFLWGMGIYLVHVLLPDVMEKVAYTSHKRKEKKIIVV